MHFNKIILLQIIFSLFIITGCSNNIYDNYSTPLLDRNKISINGEIKNNEPLELSIYNKAKYNPDSLFDNWLYKKPKRINRLNKLISNKQVNQLKRYNKLFNNWIKSTGEEPVFLNKTDIENNINRLIQYYKNNAEC